MWRNWHPIEYGSIFGDNASGAMSTVCRPGEIVLTLSVSHIRLVVEFARCIWYKGYLKNESKLDRLQREFTMEIDGLLGTMKSVSRRFVYLPMKFVYLGSNQAKY